MNFCDKEEEREVIDEAAGEGVRSTRRKPSLAATAAEEERGYKRSSGRRSEEYEEDTIVSRYSCGS